MHRLRFSLAILILLFVFVSPQSILAHAPQHATQQVPGVRVTRRLIVKMAVGGDSLASFTAQLPIISQVAGHDLALVRQISTGAFVVELAQPSDTADMAVLAQLLSAQALSLGIAYVEPDRIVVPTLTPNDPTFASQWNLQAVSGNLYGINAPAAWDITTGSDGTVVAVLDTGIRPDHPEFFGRLLPGFDFISDVDVSNDGDTWDTDASDPGDWVTAEDAQSNAYQGCPVQGSTWHGTHVAGIIGATGNNSLGIAGINWKARLLTVRVLGKCGGYVSDIADGILWAAGFPVLGAPLNLTPAKIINLSLGSPGTCSTTEQLAITTANTLGSIIVVAAGNSNINVSGQAPANCTGVIAVAATDRYGNKASYSNFGSGITISAPGGGGEGIYSTVGIGSQGPQGVGYTFKAGTSMAAPHVSGVLSLMMAVNPLLTPLQAPGWLKTGVTAFPAGSMCNPSNCGPGIVNARAAVNAARGGLGGILPPLVTALPIGIVLTTLPPLPIAVLATSAPTVTPVPTAPNPSSTPDFLPSATSTPNPSPGIEPTNTPAMDVPPESTAILPSATATTQPISDLVGTPSSTDQPFGVPSFHLVDGQVELRWRSNMPTYAVVTYGLRPGIYLDPVQESDYTYSHAMRLPEMVPGPLYFYVITQYDSTGLKTVTDELTIRLPAWFSCYMPLLLK